ncbi:hypothetical protein RDI58_015404 [Solanum bulbocastanum]
MISHI